MIEIGKGGQRAVTTVMMSRYACYLVIQNADPSSATVAKSVIDERNFKSSGKPMISRMFFPCAAAGLERTPGGAAQDQGAPDKPRLPPWIE